MKNNQIKIVHFSDLLCVWAYISQIRIDELEANFPDQVHMDYRFFPVFGDVAGKVASQWSDRGGIKGYAEHVQEVAGQFEHVEINPEAWLNNTPASSLPAHLIACGTKVLMAQNSGRFNKDLIRNLLKNLRHAFFVNLADLSDQQTLLRIADESGVPVDILQQTLDHGTAHAQLAEDLSTATQSGIRSSPTLSFNEGRQMLAGNVGYRVIEANIRELLNNPADQQSWC